MIMTINRPLPPVRWTLRTKALLGKSMLAKRNFERKLAKDIKKNPKAFYSYLKSKTSNRVSVGPLKDDNEMHSDDEKMSELLNTFFSSVFTKEDLSLLPQPKQVYLGSSPLTHAPFRKNW